MVLHVFTDGGSRGNPGNSGFGVIIKADTAVIHQIGQNIGIKTNNEAEYSGLIYALTWLIANPQPAQKIIFYSDSELLFRQVQGIYRVKAPNLKSYHQNVVTLLKNLTLPYHFHNIRREFNSEADALANQAMDRQQ